MVTLLDICRAGDMNPKFTSAVEYDLVLTQPHYDMVVVPKVTTTQVRCHCAGVVTVMETRLLNPRIMVLRFDRLWLYACKYLCRGISTDEIGWKDGWTGLRDLCKNRMAEWNHPKN